MNRSPRIRIDSFALTSLLAGRPVSTTQRGSLPRRGESYPVTLQEPTDVRAVVLGSKLQPRAQRVWTLDLILDRTDTSLLLNAESGGGSITPLAENRSASEPAAHGYVDSPGPNVLDAGDAVPHADVETFASSREAAHNFATEKINELSRRRARSLSNRVRDSLMQATAKGVDVGPALVAIEEQLKLLKLAAREAA